MYGNLRKHKEYVRKHNGTSGIRMEIQRDIWDIHVNMEEYIENMYGTNWKYTKYVRK